MENDGEPQRFTRARPEAPIRARSWTPVRRASGEVRGLLSRGFEELTMVRVFTTWREDQGPA